MLGERAGGRSPSSASEPQRGLAEIDSRMQRIPVHSTFPRNPVEAHLVAQVGGGGHVGAIGRAHDQHILQQAGTCGGGVVGGGGRCLAA